MNRKDISYIQKMIEMEKEAKEYITKEQIDKMAEIGMKPEEITEWIRVQYNQALTLIQIILENQIAKEIKNEKEKGSD